ncbi:casein kinase I [Drosophila rhopaloa]|uniref:non-specific serine/threonine protein kinase n=1 Tax=Drosophila rhopaloa TaxID=1041015 RepID=A0A6P4FHK4_DRORH|nr:casein kinase I [Drosophila rhopaloa]
MGDDYLKDIEAPFNILDYAVGRKIGSGSFGEIYRAKHRKTGLLVALKVEPNSAHNLQLCFEYQLYNILSQGAGIPKVYRFHSARKYNVMVMELLGPSLEDLFIFCKHRFSLKTVLMLAEQMIERLEFLHSHNFLHRDIKPDNFVMGRGDTRHRLYLIDLGLAKQFSNVPDNKCVIRKSGSRLTGTARYASVNALRGGEQSRRDDLESLGYVLMYLLRGTLPWQGLKATSKIQKHEMIAEMKVSTRVEDLCRGYPDEFFHFIVYSRAIRFEEEPNYLHTRRSFLDLLHRLKFPNDKIYDWDILNKKMEELNQKKAEEKVELEFD